MGPVRARTLATRRPGALPLTSGLIAKPIHFVTLAATPAAAISATRLATDPT